MRNKRNNPPKRLLCGVGLSIVLTVPVQPPLLAKSASLAHAEGNAPPQQERAAPLEAGRECRPLPAPSEPVPELLALADWPLDEAGRSEGCGATPGAGMNGAPAAAAVPLEPPVEIVASPVVRVLAAGMEEETPGAAPPAQRVAIVSPEELDDIRGGFELPDLGLKFSFGIERAVYINGELVASTVLNVVNLQNAAGGTAPAVVLPANPVAAMSSRPSTPQPPPAGSVPVGNNAGSGASPAPVVPPIIVQTGTGNGISIQLGPNLAGTVIQNSLNDQQIKTITTISGTVNSAQILRAMNLQSAIQDGLLGSLRR